MGTSASHRKPTSAFHSRKFPSTMSTTMQASNSQLVARAQKVGSQGRIANSRALAPKYGTTVQQRSVSIRAEQTMQTPTPPPPPQEPFAMNFNGFAPETVNGRLAQIGFVAGLGAEIATGESFLTQFQTHPVAFGFATVLITAATFMPSMQQANNYTSDPKSVPNQGMFNANVEKMNGRAAMIGMVAMLATEAIKGGALLGSVYHI